MSASESKSVSVDAAAGFDRRKERRRDNNAFFLHFSFAASSAAAAADRHTDRLVVVVSTCEIASLDSTPELASKRPMADR